MKILLLGAPGAGKSSLCPVLRERYSICDLREDSLADDAVLSHDERSAEIQAARANQTPLRDELLAGLFVDAIRRRAECSRGYVLDGFPATAEQASLLKERGLRPDALLVLDVPKEEVLRRLSGRWFHERSRRIYHTQYCPPKTEGLDDVTGEALKQRDEDRPEVVAARVNDYQANTMAVRAFYHDPLVAAARDGEPGPGEGQRKRQADDPAVHVIAAGGLSIHDVRSQVVAILDPLHRLEKTAEDGSWWKRMQRVLF